MLIIQSIVDPSLCDLKAKENMSRKQHRSCGKGTWIRGINMSKREQSNGRKGDVGINRNVAN